MRAKFEAVKLTLLALISVHLPDIAKKCPYLVSSPGRRIDPPPQALIDQLPKEVQAADEGEGVELLFLGDSITELWRGTDQGRPYSRTEGAEEVFHRHFGKYRSLVLGVGGDQVAHLHWRILNGNLPVRHQPQVVVVMAGVNDLLMGKGCWPGNSTALSIVGNVTAFRTMEMMQTLVQRLPSSYFVLALILPGGDFDDKDRWQWPNPLSPGILSANSWTSKAFTGEERVAVVDCGPRFLPTGSWIEPTLQGDGLHPSQQGIEELATCISPHVENGMRAASSHLSTARVTDRHLSRDHKHNRRKGDTR